MFKDTTSGDFSNRDSRFVSPDFFKNFIEPRNRFQWANSASLCSLAGRRYDNPIPTRFLAPIDCSKIPAQLSLHDSLIRRMCGNLQIFWWRMWYQFPQIHSRSLSPPFLANISPPFPSWPIILGLWRQQVCVCERDGKKCYVEKTILYNVPHCKSWLGNSQKCVSELETICTE